MPKAKELRARAREQLGNKIFGNKWLYMVLACFVLGLLLGISSVVVILFVGPVTVAMCAGFLKHVRNADATVEVNDFACTVNGEQNLGRSVLLGLLTTLFTLFWSLLFVIPGIIKSYAYAMAPYIALDNKELDANDLITASRKMMRGHKWQLFCLDFSFLGWMILGALCLGIGTLWVVPYQEMAHANFYEELVKQNAGKEENA